MTTEPPTHVAAERRAVRPLVWQAVAVVVLYAAVGAGAGWLWHHLWDPPTGVAVDGRFYLDSAGLRGEFSSTGWFVVVAAGVGLVLGVGCALLVQRSELVTLVAVVVGAALATYVMWKVGLSLSAEDPARLARSATDGDRLPARIEVSGGSPFLVLPAASLAALAVAYAGFPKRRLRRG
ncbi:hypothetical protein [Nocardioides sp. 503]|uniref:hypothetical protein n=1 Tax=Nocardioides sp. 503 TaxID=2508326 RepID=UPI001431C4B2|nr:hypothetical protein [Nocardioides sp. 503]